jgi:hypothetical protein
MMEHRRKSVTWHDPVALGFISFLLIILLVPVVTVSGDSGANWNDAYALINSTMDYIMKNHPDAPSTLRDGSSWSLVTAPSKDCNSGYKYKGGGWTLVICYLDTTTGTCNITATYESSGLMWTGTVRKGKLVEISYRNPLLK